MDIWFHVLKKGTEQNTNEHGFLYPIAHTNLIQ